MELGSEEALVDRIISIRKERAEIDNGAKFDSAANQVVLNLKIIHELEYQLARLTTQETEPEPIRALKQIYSEKILKQACLKQLATTPPQRKIKPKAGHPSPPCKTDHFVRKFKRPSSDAQTGVSRDPDVSSHKNNNHTQKHTINLITSEKTPSSQSTAFGKSLGTRPSKTSKSGIGQNRSVNYGNLDPEIITRPTEVKQEKQTPKIEEKSPFTTGWEKLNEDEAAKGKTPTSRGPKRGFQAPRGNNEPEEEERPQKKQKKEVDIADNPLYKNVDPAMIERINNDILTTQLNVYWDDIAGLEDVKATLNEMIISPHKRPDLFTGLRQPPRGLLLFGPPGNGKTLIAKAVATEANLTFFAISASSLTSKWIGDGEKMVKALFAVARDKQPSFVFIDEIDSILTSRGSEEHEATRRLKTEFLLQFDGAASGGDTERITIMGATNRPQDLDEAARRRLTKRIYVPLPEDVARERLIQNLLKKTEHSLSDEDITALAKQTEGFSGYDLTNLCKDAAMGPLRENKFIELIAIDKLRAINMNDFQNSLRKIKPSVSVSECVQFEEWNQLFGESGL